MANVDYEEITKKYQQMAKSRRESGDININDYLPSIYDMIKEDCVWSALKSMQSEISDTKDEEEDIAYYSEKPPTTELGYHEDSQCFVLHANKFKVNKGDWDLGVIDGDTWTFKLSDLSTGSSFKINNKEYNTFKDYVSDQDISCSNIQIRAIGIDASEICHYTTCVVPKNTEVKIESYERAVRKGYIVKPHKINRHKSSNPDDWTITNYDNDEHLKFLNYNGTYYQIEEDYNADDYLTDVDYDHTKNKSYVIVASNEWGSESIKDGYTAQYRAREIIENKNIKDIIVIVDRNTVTGRRINNNKYKYYNSFLYTAKNIETMIDELANRDIMNFSLASAEMLPFGCDKYGRLLGNVWVKIGTSDGDMWINLAKYVMTGTKMTENNPSFYNTDMSEIYGGASDIFKQWTNVSNTYRYADSLSESGEESYNDRIKLHKKLTGIDFTEARDHTVLLGDTLFMIPPEAIHTSTTLDYEKLPILRGKGSMMKNRSNIEELLELELYFNNEYGINGIPYETTTPNGTKVTYYMNGLRSLIAQFKVAPFLPIENHYINDILNIEVVSLVNINVSTVEGFPRLLKVILTLRDFNYRVFMPDLPLPEYDTESTEISEMQHIFAKQFNWELFRYYYQRGIMNGEQLAECTYNKGSYNDLIYSNKNLYKPAELTNSDFELYVPDVSWLKYALQVKKARDMYGQVDLEGAETTPSEDSETPTNKNKEELLTYYDYKNPRNMKFVPYLQDENGKSVPLELDAISFNMANYFTETHLKAVPGFAPQYMGGSDVNIELRMTISDEYYVGVLNNLPHTILNMIRNYRRVMPCFPLKIKNEYLQMIGVNEVVLDNVSVSTKPGFPGVYDVVIKLTSMDRTMRQREALQKSNVEGSMTSSDAADTIGNYFNLQQTLAAAELYPDLDLPTITELSDLGWGFAKWANEDRIYVDPDFYICYSFQYTSKLIKGIIKDALYAVSYKAGKEQADARESGESVKNSNAQTKSNTFNSLRFVDDSGIGMDLSGGIEYDGVNVDAEYGFSSLYEDIMEDVQSKANSDDTKKKKVDKSHPTKEQIKSVATSLEYLTALGIENGWEIAPGWYAPICDEFINEEMEDFEFSGIEKTKDSTLNKDMYIEEIYDLRHRAIMLINRILDQPLTTSRDKSDDPLECVYNAVQNLLGSGAGKQLVDLLCPMQYEYQYTENKVEMSKQNDDHLKLDPEFFEYPDPMRWIQGYLYALACSRSGSEEYSESTKDCNWQAQQWQNKKYDSSDQSAALYGYKDGTIPYNKIRQGRGNAGDNMLADTYESWTEDGVSFGAGQLTIYNRSTIKEHLQPESKIKYFNYDYKGGASEYYNNMYHKTKRAGRKRFCETGFIDQYYNFAGYKSKEGKEYIEHISNSQTANYEALLREVLMYLKFLIMDGYIFSEVDIISQDWEDALSEIVKIGSAVSGSSTANSGANYFVNSYRNDLLEGMYDTNGDNTDDEVEEGTKQADKLEKLKEEIPKSYNKIFCSRLIYPFALASCNGNKSVLQLFKDRDYDTLNVYTLSSNVGGSNNTQFNKFLSDMYGVGMIGSCNSLDSSETTSNTQKAFNTLMSEAFTYMAEDPRCYALHSMYDMCVTDKRGRLLRAFPCYYVLFVDEGRMIGSWKLFDNFYNMSSISDIQVVKSRKIPADTCTFTMSNMFMSYADTYDNTIYQQYVNIYGVKDIVSSIFSPRSYVEKEDMIRQRKQLTDTTPITAGVRIHVRMGYGSDGSRLPIVFNGKVAEINCGETVEIVAQGDGHELNNPLNTLGELTAINLDESQTWCTLFKDIRGSLSRGGQTPRNLLAKLATAQYGGAFKTIVRENTQGRFFYDNPFGIYHFGDKRFKDIFEDSEIVQNMYEVSNKNILNGVNDLLDDTSTVNATPTINCNLQDKTMWEVGHLCANSGDDFYFAVRDFGLRSTLCLCKANHYYAYEYQQATNGAIVERRKPFQQYHYYDSYNDIIYNNLKASETNMKTNAVGTWEGTDVLWGTAQQSVGPIYLDMNIYPEYQKSMMVDTGLVAGGDGGIDIPILNHFVEKFNYDEYDGRVNKSLAEKVTTNVLRQSVKDMYEGEICIIGDTSLKPYDRATLVDLYEDMSGDVEVETVIHSMNIETGFTTTFIPDVIVRGEHTAQECGFQSVLSNIITGLFGAVTLKGALTGMASKGVNGLLALGAEETTKGIGAAAAKKVTESAIGTFFKGFSTEALADASLSTLLLNPVALISAGVAAASVFILTSNIKEGLFRWCRNIQALTVFPITKNGRLLIAGMAGHRGSVYGYKYSKWEQENSIQNIIMNIEDWKTDNVGLQIVNSVFKFLLTDDNYDKIKNKWINNLGLETSTDILNENAGDVRNQEAFRQQLSKLISKEYTSRSTALAAMKTKPRITTFNTSGRTSSVYLKYQIGGVHDLDNSNNDETRNAVTVQQLGTNERIKALHPLEDEPDIKIALNSDVHPVIKKFIFAHSSSPLTFNLKMESENTVIRYIAEGEGNTKIFDLPMLQEDAVTLVKLIINTDNLKGKTVTFLSGTRVNDTASWKSTGFWFSLSCDDMTALEAASAEVRKDSSWTQSSGRCFAYNNTGKSIQYTVYAPLEFSTNVVSVIEGDDTNE